VLHAYYGDAPSRSSTAAYLPMLGLTGAAAFAFAQKKQRWLKALLLTQLFASAVPALCGAFALFTNTAYTRWWYGLALLLTLASLYALRDLRSRRAWLAAFAACSAAAAALTIPFLLPQGMLDLLPERIAGIILSRRTDAYAPDALRILSICLTLLGGAGMLLVILKKHSFRAAMAVLCVCTCVQYGGYIAVGDKVILSGGTQPGNGVYTLEQIAKPTLAALELPETDGYKRIDYGPMLRNYGLIRGSSSLTCFSSLRTSTVGRFVSMAGFGYDESTTVRPPDSSPAMRALLSVTEYHQTNGEDVPEGFVYSHEENGFAVYTNPNAVPMGFLQTTMTGTHHQRMDSETVGSVLLAAAAMDDAYLAQFEGRMQKLDVYSIPDWKQSVQRLQENACYAFETRADGFTARIDAKEAGLVVFTIPHDKGFRAQVDGKAADVIPCSVSFMGVWVEPGEHEIVFTYSTRMLSLGIAMSALAAAVLAGYVLLARRKRR